MYKILLVANNQEKVIEYLEKFKQENNINENYLIEILPLKEEIVLSQIKGLKKELLTPFEKERWIIFYNFETANQESQNALLKTIEETKFNNFVFVTNNEYKILPTLRSRLKIVRLGNNQLQKLSDLDLEIIEKVAKKPLSQLKTISKFDRQTSLEFLNKLLIYYQGKLINDKKTVTIIKKIFNLHKLIQDNNLNQQLALDNLLIFIHKTSMI